MGQAVTDMAHQRCLRGNETLSPAAWSTQLVASLGRTGISFAWSVEVTNGATGQIGDYYPTAISKNGSTVLGETGGNMLARGAGPLRPGSCRAHEPRLCSGRGPAVPRC